MALALHWIPDSLYNLSISAVVSNFASFEKELETFHGSVLFDVYYKLYKEGHLCRLRYDFAQLTIFDRLLHVKDKRYLLHHCFQALMDQNCGIATNLATTYKVYCGLAQKDLEEECRGDRINLGFLLGNFFSDAGWFRESETVFLACLELCRDVNSGEKNKLMLECYSRLLNARNSYCDFRSAHETYLEATAFIEELDADHSLSFAGLFSEFSAFHFLRSNYNEALKWSVAALRELATCKWPKVAVSVLRQASKACVVKREFKRANMLIKQALYISRTCFGNRHPVMASTLIDYGFYLLHVDSLCHSIKVYQAALEMRQYIFGGQNILVAIVHEDIAYAYYVHEYSSGKFKDAREHAEKAMAILTHLLPENHLLLASAKRVKALILEEQALDNHDRSIMKRLLLEAQELHTSALHLVQEVHGEMNVLTAKYYGNLGRLYQSMQRCEEAREMHLKAIKIKEHILGPEDYEVALSVGHLASLYNYDMMLYEKAEELYLRSISIGRKLFGKSYSGLVFDYRGLLRVYQCLNNVPMGNRYLEIIHEWKLLRDEAAQKEKETSPLDIHLKPIELDTIYQEFLSVA